MARKQDKVPSKKKEKYRTSNWPEYNRFFSGFLVLSEMNPELRF
jgi:hypothetical protein